MKIMAHYTEDELIGFLESGQPNEVLASHLKDCPVCAERCSQLKTVMDAMHRASVQPPVGVSLRFEEMIQEETRTNTSSFSWYQLAAAVALVIAGFLVGKWTADDHREEVIALQSQVDLLKEMTVLGALSQQTASERIQAVQQIESSAAPANDAVVEALIRTLNTDESPNVRYAAAQALQRFTQLEKVRTALAQSLELQQDPLIQIALISILVEAQEKQAIGPIQKLLEQRDVAPEVKKQGQVALQILI